MTAAPYDEPLFPESLAGPRIEPEPDPMEGLGQDARRTMARQRSLELGIHPVTKRPLHADAAPVGDRAAEGLRCTNCVRCFTSEYHNKTYVKCDAVDLTFGPGSDTRRWYPACTAFKPKEEA